MPRKPGKNSPRLYFTQETEDAIILYNSSSGNVYVELYNKYPEGLGAVKVILANFFSPACLSIHIFIACLTFLFLNCILLTSKASEHRTTLN